MTVQLHVGTRLPAYCTSMGRVLLSGLHPADRDAFLAAATIRANTTKTITSPSQIADAIGEAGERGFSVVDEELELGLRSIAVPVRNRAGTIVAAINVSTQSARCSMRDMQRNFLPPLKAAARKIEDFFVVQ